MSQQSNQKINQAIILSAGFGTRLRPLTDNIPKVMVPFNGKPLLEYHIEQLKKYGITDIFINLHYLPEVVMNYFGDGSLFGVHVTYKIETPEILGTAGGIKNFEDNIHGDFFVVYGDVFNQIDYERMEEAFYTKDNAIGMEIIRDTDRLVDSDLVDVDENLKFKKIHPKPHEKIPLSGKGMQAVFILTQKIFSYIPSNTFYMIDNQVLPKVLASSENFYGYECADYMEDVGTFERYDKVVKYLTKSKLA